MGGFRDEDNESVTEIADSEAPEYAGYKVMVNFIGENSHAQLPIDKVLPFEASLAEFKNSKKKVGGGGGERAGLAGVNRHRPVDP